MAFRHSEYLRNANPKTIFAQDEHLFFVQLHDILDLLGRDRFPTGIRLLNQVINVRPSFGIELESNGFGMMLEHEAQILADFGKSSVHARQSNPIDVCLVRGIVVFVKSAVRLSSEVSNVVLDGGRRACIHTDQISDLFVCRF